MGYAACSKGGQATLLPSSSWRKAGPRPVAGASGRSRKQDAKDLGQDDPGNVDASACAWLRVDRPHQARAGQLRLLHPPDPTGGRRSYSRSWALRGQPLLISDCSSLGREIALMGNRKTTSRNFDPRVLALSPELHDKSSRQHCVIVKISLQLRVWEPEGPIPNPREVILAGSSELNPSSLLY